MKYPRIIITILVLIPLAMFLQSQTDWPIESGTADNIYVDSIADKTGTGAPEFPEGALMDDAAGQDPLNFYRTETLAMTFQFNNSLNTVGATVIITRIGNLVSIFIPASTTTSNANDVVLATGTTLPAWAIPTTRQRWYQPAIVSNGTTQTTAGWFDVTTGGAIGIYRNGASGAWEIGSPSGLLRPMTVTYIID